VSGVPHDGPSGVPHPGPPAGLGPPHAVSGLPPAWPPPTPLDAQHDLPPFPVDSLPGWLREFVEGLAVATQTPPALGGLLSLAAIATAAAKQYEVRARAGWSEPLSLYSTVVLASGNRKSAVLREVVRPLEEREHALLEGYRGDLAEAQARRGLLEQQLKAARAQARNGGEDEGAEVLRLSRRLAELGEDPPPPRLLADDVTPEALASLLARSGGRMGVFAAEGGLFDLLAGRYSGASNLDVLLKAHAGDSLRVDRKGRPPESVPAPCLSLGLAVQPEVLGGLAARDGFRGRGLLARLLYGLPASTLGRRDCEPPPLDDGVRAEYGRRMRGLLERCAEPGPTPTPLQLDPAAHGALVDLMRWLEPQLGPGGELSSVADWAGKLAGAVCRIAGVLHLAEVDPDTAAVPPWVGRDTTERALAIGGRFLLPHARAAFDAMGVDEQVERAKVIVAWLRRHHLSDVSRRDVHQGLRAHFRRVADVDPPLRILLDHGHLRGPHVPPSPGPGRPPSPRYAVHPDLRAGLRPGG